MKKKNLKIFSVALLETPKHKKSILDHHLKCAKEKPCQALQETFTIHHPSTMKQSINRRKTASPLLLGQGPLMTPLINKVTQKSKQYLIPQPQQVLVTSNSDPAQAAPPPPQKKKKDPFPFRD